MSEIVRFETNVPVEMALKFDEGKLVEGQYGDQIMCTLVDGRIVYLNPVVDEKRKRLGIRKGDPFAVCKREVKKGQRRSIEWQIERVELAPEETDIPAGRMREVPTELERDLAESIERVKAARAARTGVETGPRIAGSAGSTSRTEGQQLEHSTPARVNAPAETVAEWRPAAAPETRAKTKLEDALCTAVAAAASAQNYGRTVGVTVVFTAEDIRAMAITLVIGASREGGAR